MSNLMARLLKKRDLSILLYQNLKQFVPEVNVLNNGRNTRIYSTRICRKNTFRIQENYLQRFYSVKPVLVNETDGNYLSENKVTIIGDDIPSPYTNIEDCGFPDYIKDYLKQHRITKPTVIQSQGWPIVLSGQNFVGIAQTGTGKTLAYLLPAVVHIKEKKARKSRGPIVLILAPTRELARQIQAVAKDFMKLFHIRCACIYGGASRSLQAGELEAGVDIVIATPGRLNDFLTSKTTTLSRCNFIVLDEADRMLDMGFEPQIRQALEGIPKERQILMFSATWPKEVQHLAKDYLQEYVQVNVGSTELSANHNIQQHIHICDQDSKLLKFKEIMKSISGDGFQKILVFTNTKKYVDNLALILKKHGWPAVGIHGDKTQFQRDAIINQFKRGHANILVATDVAARGLDVDGVSHVINYDFPNTTEDYIHRIGRTGRQDNKGVSHTILTRDDDDRQARNLIAVLREAKQEIPDELINMAKNYSFTKAQEQQAKYKSKRNTWNENKRWNKFHSSSQTRNRFSVRNDRYVRYNRFDNDE